VQVLVDHKLQSAALRRQIDQIGREREALEAKRDDITRAVNDVSCCTSTTYTILYDRV
jgi:enoyl reductase-like protein